MPRQLFISDLHLDVEVRPDTVALFERFLARQVRPGDTLFILGDLFEIWIGDEASADSELGRRCRQALRQCTDRGTRVFLQKGNRDFLVGERFLRDAGAAMLPELHILPVAGQPTLLLHGDLLCSDDAAYQRWRRFAQGRLASWIWNLLPLRAQRGLGDRIRTGSRKSNAMKAGSIMDVNDHTVVEFFDRHGVNHMIHGHTHRPALHEHALPGGKTGYRYVLDQWHEDHASVLVDDGRVLAPQEIPGP